MHATCEYGSHWSNVEQTLGKISTLNWKRHNQNKPSGEWSLLVRVMIKVSRIICQTKNLVNCI